MTHFSENLLDLSSTLINDAFPSINCCSDEFAVASGLHVFLELVMDNQGSPIYMPCHDINNDHENAIFGINKKLAVMYGLTHNDITHISIDGIWYDLDEDDSISDDFMMTIDRVQSDIENKTLVTRIVDNQPFSHIAWNNAKLCNTDTVYKEYCYLVDVSNWKDIATATYKCIVALTSN